MALRLGATVIGTASETNLDYVRSLGAVPVLYGSGLVARVRSLAPVGIDAVIDTSGKGALPDSIELRGGTERIVTIADPMAKQFGVAFSVGTPITRSPEDLAELAQLVADGMVTVAIAKTLPLADAAEAHELSESGHAGGKIILIVD
jgi:NADPH:quinone reductase-like Zn-dependent oxidoreductase